MRIPRPLLAAALAWIVLAVPATPIAGLSRVLGQADVTRAGPWRVLGRAGVPLARQQVASRSVDVFGYLPYWEIDASTDGYLRYDVLDTIALFGVSFRTDGSLITTDPGYEGVTGATAATIIGHAHAAGDRVAITFESFNADHNARFLSDPQAQAAFIANAVGLVRGLGADGVSIDLEGLSSSYFAAYGTFVGAVRQAVLAGDPAGQVSVATNSGTSGAQMAASAVANGADRVFLMAYDYRSAGSSPVGSIDPLLTASGIQDLTWSLDQYAADGVPAQKLILGLPLYGRQWPTLTSGVNSGRQPAATSGGGGPVLVRDLPTAAAGLSAGYDTLEQSVVLRGWDAAHATWTQLYYDDAAALAPKAQLALRRGLAGIGLWALGFDQGQPGYWDVLASLHRGLELSHVAVTPFISRSRSVTVHIGWKSAGYAVTGVRLSNDGTSWSSWRPATPAIRWTLSSGSDGLRAVEVQVRDTSGALSTIRPVDVVLERYGPLLSTLTLAWSASSRKWVARFAAADPSGVTGYAFQYRIGSGPWRELDRTVTGTTVRIGAALGAHVTVRVRAVDAAGLWSSWHTVSTP